MASNQPRPAGETPLTLEVERRLQKIEGSINTINVARHMQYQSFREANSAVKAVEQSYISLGDQVSEAIEALSVARDLLSDIQRFALPAKQGARIEELPAGGQAGPGDRAAPGHAEPRGAAQQETSQADQVPQLRHSRGKKAVLAVEGPAASEGKPGEQRIRTRNGWRWISEEKVALIQCPESLELSQASPGSPGFGLHRFLEIFIPIRGGARRALPGRPDFYTVHLECQYCLSRLTGKTTDIAHEWVTAIEETEQHPHRYCRHCGQTPRDLNPLSEQTQICERHPNAPSHRKLVLLQEIEFDKNAVKNELWEREQAGSVSGLQRRAAETRPGRLTTPPGTNSLVVVEAAGEPGGSGSPPPPPHRPPPPPPGSSTAGAAAGSTAGETLGGGRLTHPGSQQ